LKPSSCEDLPLKSCEDVRIETRDRLRAPAKREQSRAVLDHGDAAESRRSRREEIAVCAEPPPVDEGLAPRLDSSRIAA
jgi:hypothetical protein